MKVAEIRRPVNCTELRATVEVDTIVNKLLKHPTKKFDERMKVVGTALTKAGACFTKVVDGLQKLSNEDNTDSIKELTGMAMGGLAVLGHGFHNVCLRRRELHKPDVGQAWKYENLFAAEVPHNAYLYGGNENVEKMIKDIGTNNTAAHRLQRGGASGFGSYNSGYVRNGPGPMRNRGRDRASFHPYPRPGGFNRGRHGGRRSRGRGRARGWAQQSSYNTSMNRGEVSSELVDKVSMIESEISDKTPQFSAGRLGNFIQEWRKITSDSEILQTVAGLKIEFVDNTAPVQTSTPSSYFNMKERAIVDAEVQTLLQKGVLEETTPVDGEYLSNIFLRPKKNGSFRLILNLKNFNCSVEYHHFKMETFDIALKLISKGCFMASIDLKDAYYGIPIHEDYRKYLRFIWRDTLLQFTCLPNGLSCGPRKYTKIMKPVYSLIREAGHKVTGFLDDMLIVADTKTELENSVRFILNTLTELGFVINWEKSVLSPRKRISHLGFIIDSDSMTVTLPEDKMLNVISLCTELTAKNEDTIRQVAKVIGTLVATFPAVQLGQLRYRELEYEKDKALKISRGNFDTNMQITENMKEELLWWTRNVEAQNCPIIVKNPDKILTSDASNKGWGGTCDSDKFGGRWNSEEMSQHINYLELLGAFFVMRSCEDKIVDRRILLLLDNTTAIAYINNMGGKKGQLNTLAKEIWEWCLVRKIWLSASHLPGVDNVDADYESRHFNDRSEWSLNGNTFLKLTEIFGTPDIDLFASRLNTKCKCYVAWQRDPKAAFIDAFSRSWHDFYAYIFPPFSLIGRCLQKVQAEETRALIVVPCWATQPWFPQFLEMLCMRPVLLPQMDNLLTLEFSSKLHPLRQKLRMIAGCISGNATDSRDYRSKLPQSYYLPGNQAHTNNIPSIYGNGMHFVCRGKQIVLNHL